MPTKNQEQVKIGGFSLSEKTVSTFLGLVVVLVVGGLVFNYFNNKSNNVTIGDNGEAGQLEGGIVNETESLPGMYTVKEGDSLWKISESLYDSGYNWVDIASENGLSNPDAIEVGQELKIPSVEAKTETVAVLPETGAGDSVSAGEYTVQKGDWLSKISLRAYGDMFAWEKIYEANKGIIGANPHMIEEGMVLTIPN